MLVAAPGRRVGGEPLGRTASSCLLLSTSPAPCFSTAPPVLGGGWAGQIGRVLVPDPDWSGERACLEDVASVDAMVRRYTAGIVDDSTDSIGSVGSGVSDDIGAGRTGSPFSGLDSLLSAMRSGDREARRVWDTGLDALADLIARGGGLLGPLDVVLSSELTRAGEAVFLEPLRQRVADLMAGCRRRACCLPGSGNRHRRWELPDALWMSDRVLVIP